LIIAARILKNTAPYTDIEVIEEHFKNKPEISGTAKKIADCLDVPEEAIKIVGYTAWKICCCPIFNS
jgi:4-hydroxy-tetrahydrodipicolinate reductase